MLKTNRVGLPMFDQYKKTPTVWDMITPPLVTQSYTGAPCPVHCPTNTPMVDLGVTHIMNAAAASLPDTHKVIIGAMFSIAQPNFGRSVGFEASIAMRCNQAKGILGVPVIAKLEALPAGTFQATSAEDVPLTIGPPRITLADANAGERQSYNVKEQILLTDEAVAGTYVMGILFENASGAAGNIGYFHGKFGFKTLDAELELLEPYNPVI